MSALGAAEGIGSTDTLDEDDRGTRSVGTPGGPESWTRLAIVCAVVGALCGCYLLTVALRDGTVWAPAAMLVVVNVVHGIMGWRWR